MSDTMVASSLDDLLEPLVQCLDRESAERVIAYRVSERVKTRVHYLAEQANEGLLTDKERSEYQTLVETADLIGILKLMAKSHLEALDRE
jgi:hypothetical protein